MKKTHTITIATRQSPLALWQAEFVKQRLMQTHPGLSVKLLGITTQGDKWLHSSLAKIGGKGLFIKELEQALQNQQADIAVHSMKDLPMELPEGFELCAICQRASPLDALVSNKFDTLSALPQGAVIGTSSLRRQSQLLHQNPTLKIIPVRGNVGSRLNKLDQGEYDALILATAGLERLDLADRIKARITPEQLLPAVGQGAVGIECRENDERIRSLVEPLSDPVTTQCVIAERALSRSLQGSCQLPLAGFAQIEQNQLKLRGLVAYADGREQISESVTGDIDSAEQIGQELAQELLARGAQKILEESRH